MFGSSLSTLSSHSQHKSKYIKYANARTKNVLTAAPRTDQVFGHGRLEIHALRAIEGLLLALLENAVRVLGVPGVVHAVLA